MPHRWPAFPRGSTRKRSVRPRRRGSAGTEGRLRRGWRRGPGRSGAWGGSGKSYAKALEKRGFDAEAQEKRGEARIGADWREEAALRWASAGSEWTRVSELVFRVPVRPGWMLTAPRTPVSPSQLGAGPRSWADLGLGLGCGVSWEGC